VILICVLILGAAVELSLYYYVQKYAPNLTTAASPSELASFRVANLTINPFEAMVNQPVAISVGVANLGSISGSYSLSFKINGLVVETKELALSANESQQVTFSVTESIVGSYNVTVGDLAGIFSVSSKPTPMPATLKLSNLNLNTSEAWPGQLINASVDVHNTGNESVSYQLPFFVNGQVAQTVQLQLAPSNSTIVSALISESSVGSYQLAAGGESIPFSIVPAGEHTLNFFATQDGIPFTLDGVSHVSPYIALVPVGPHTLVVQSTAQVETQGWGLVSYAFTSWDDGSTSTSRTVNVQGEVYVAANYVRTTTSCPELYVWNGTGYNFVADVNDGTGWLGFLEYFNPDGSMVFSYNYPYDYIKLDPTQLQPLNGFYSVKIAEDTNEIFYLDSVKLIAVDHPADVDVFSTKSTFVYNLAGQGTIYTVSKNLASPVSAVNGQGQNVLPLISKLDNVFTTATRWSWNNITLNLGNLAGAKNIYLVVAARTDWPSTQAGGENFMSYADEPGVMPSPPPYMQVKAENGSWVNVPDDRQFPIPATTDQEFVVNLTGLFPTNNFELRINYYQDIQFDYIGVSRSPQQNIITYTLTPSSADLTQAFVPNSTSSGAFTRYGDVTALLQSADNEFVIGREGDVVSIQFPADLPPVPKGWVRDYFVVTNCWFKGDGLPYVPFTVDPLPFQAMTSFPYPSNETYPNDATHEAYLQTYDTRIINSP
jgi:molybdopterin-binding protein